jgi:hypothetical protein
MMDVFDMTVGEWSDKLSAMKNDQEWYVRHCTAIAVARYCTGCPDEGNGCAECKIYDLAVKNGINEPVGG